MASTKATTQSPTTSTWESSDAFARVSAVEEQQENDDSSYEYPFASEDEEEELKFSSNDCKTAAQGVKRDRPTSGFDNSQEDDDDVCELCGKESHLPLRSCERATVWAQTRHDDKAVGAQVVPAKFVLAAQEQFIQTFCVARGMQQPQGRHWLRLNNWDRDAANRAWLLREDVAMHLGGLEIRHPDEIVHLTPEGTQESLPCKICFESYADLEALECRHGFCFTCWGDYMQANADNIVDLTCPEPNCRMLVPEELVRRACPEGLEKAQQQLLNAFVRTQPFLSVCPGPDCDRFVVRTGDRNRELPLQANCSACDTRFCVSCGRQPHGTQDCLPAEAAVVNAAAEEVRAQMAVGEAALAAAAALPATAQVQSSSYPRKNCPKCSVMIEKIGGCNRMRCRCKHAFCWLCLEDMNDYNHICGVAGQDHVADL